MYTQIADTLVEAWSDPRSPDDLLILWLKIPSAQSRWPLGPDLSGIQKIVGLLAAWLTAWLDGPGFLDPLKLPYKICGCVTQKMLI
jgi:hypothetical protein